MVNGKWTANDLRTHASFNATESGDVANSVNKTPNVINFIENLCRIWADQLVAYWSDMEYCTTYNHRATNARHSDKRASGERQILWSLEAARPHVIMIISSQIL